MPGLLEAAHSQLLIVDIQEKLHPAVLNGEAVLARVLLLLQAAARLGVPVTVSEQYPAGLGHTLPGVVAALPPGSPVLEKISFSCFGSKPLKARIDDLRANGRTRLLVCGAEAHVCVLQTVMDARGDGMDVALVTDAVTSRRATDYVTAMSRMSAHHVELVTAEMVVFEWLKRAGTDDFKALAPGIRHL